jgi:hypothetical protein
VNDGLNERGIAAVDFFDNFTEKAVGSRKRISHDRRFEGQMWNPEPSSASRE